LDQLFHALEAEDPTEVDDFVFLRVIGLEGCPKGSVGGVETTIASSSSWYRSR